MIDLDLDAIRTRDKNWRENGRDSNANLASRDRHALLQYIDGLMELAEGIASDMSLIKQVHRRGYQAKPAAPETATDPAEQGQAGKGLREFHQSDPSGKLPP